MVAAPKGDPILANPNRQQRRHLDGLLSHICAWREIPRDGEQIRGCACCPPFDGCPPGSKPPAGEEIYELRSAPEGSFTGAGRQQLAATFWGCESHAANWGGTLVLDKVGGRWKKNTYRAGLNAVCDAYPRGDGTDLLLCLWYDAHQGWGHHRVTIYDLQRSEDQAWETLVDVQSNVGSACTAGVDRFPVVHHRIDNLELVDVDRDGKRDLVVPVKAIKGTTSRAYQEACWAWEQWSTEGRQGPAPAEPSSLMSKPWDVRLLFKYDGQRFVPTDQTKQALDWMHRELDEFLERANAG